MCTVRAVRKLLMRNRMVENAVLHRQQNDERSASSPMLARTTARLQLAFQSFWNGQPGALLVSPYHVCGIGVLPLGGIRKIPHLVMQSISH